MIKHTKGPWISNNSYPHNVYRDTEGIDPVICDMYDSDFIPIHERQHNSTLIALAPTAPHECGDPKCPGNINRRKLELHHDMIGLLLGASYRLKDYYYAKTDGKIMDLIKAIDSMVSKAEAIEKGE